MESTFKTNTKEEKSARGWEEKRKNNPEPPKTVVIILPISYHTYAFPELCLHSCILYSKKKWAFKMIVLSFCVEG